MRAKGINAANIAAVLGGSPGLVVMGDDSWLRDCGFKSQCCIPDEHFFILICCKKCYFLFEKTANRRKEAGVGPFNKNIAAVTECGEFA